MTFLQCSLTLLESIPARLTIAYAQDNQQRSLSCKFQSNRFIRSCTTDGKSADLSFCLFLSVISPIRNPLHPSPPHPRLYARTSRLHPQTPPRARQIISCQARCPQFSCNRRGGGWGKREAWSARRKGGLVTGHKVFSPAARDL